MKSNSKILTVVAAITIFFASCDTSIGCIGYTGFEWQIDESGGVIITAFVGRGGSVEIPAEIEGLAVTAIGAVAFWDRQLTRVTIPDGVTSIGHSAFMHNRMTSIIIPENVTYIGERAVALTQLTSVSIPESITVIEDGLFRNNHLTSVNIPSNITLIWPLTFSYNQLTSIVIGANVELLTLYGHVPFGYGFEAAYEANGRAAGRYTRPNTESTAWSRS